MRIQRLGGFVSENGRVCGNIAVARSLGDKPYQPYVSSTPAITSVNVEGAQALILACDGLWDVLSNAQVPLPPSSFPPSPFLTIAQVAALAQQLRQRAGSWEPVASGLRDTAYMLGSSDNISVMVIEFC